MVSEALEAAEQLADEEGVEATVLCLSSPDRLYRDWQAAQSSPIRHGRSIGTPHLEQLLAPDEKGLPIVSVIDGSSHALAWLGSALAVRCVPLGVDRFGQSGSRRELYDEYGISAEAIVTAALVALEP
jgi:pyruvate dehydrogenase E1 component